jgi:hypothetical protein
MREDGSRRKQETFRRKRFPHEKAEKEEIESRRRKKKEECICIINVQRGSQRIMG